MSQNGPFVVSLVRAGLLARSAATIEMFGGGSIQLARVFGIRIGVDVSWFLVLFLIIWSLSGYYEDVAPGSNAFLLAVVSALLFFLSILLHELGHAVVAIRNGIPILGHRPVAVRRRGEARQATRTRRGWSSGWRRPGRS